MASENNISINVVPWYDTAQFLKVYEYLYSSEVTKKKWAVDTISVWETRCHPSLPTAIEATHALTNTVVQDILWSYESSFIHHNDLQGMYGSAITRFVSLTVEVSKKKGCPSYSVAEVAKTVGIPSFIVDVRNEFSHSSRPSLSVLRLAAQSALKYLKESYWEKEAAAIQNYIKVPMDDKELNEEIFRVFIEYQTDVFMSQKDKTIEVDGQSRMNPEYVMIIRRMEKYLIKNKQQFVEVLVSDGIFIPDDEVIKNMISKKDCKKFNPEILDDKEVSGNTEEISRTVHGVLHDMTRKSVFDTLPKYHEDMWIPIIGLLNKYDAVPLFMELLLKTQGDQTSAGQKLLISWILKLLKIHSNHSLIGSPGLKRIFRHKGAVINWWRMLHSALANPCLHTFYIIPMIIAHLNLKVESAHNIVGLTAIKLGVVEVSEMKVSKLFHTEKDLERELKNCEKKIKQQEESCESIWTPCSDECYKLWPIGHIINAIKETGDQEMEDDDEIFDDGTLQSNKNEAKEGYDADDNMDDTYEMNEGPDFEEILSQIKEKNTILY